MGLSLGIVGLPNVGKSTLFNALTKKGVPAANYPFCTIDPSVGIVGVPDERLTRLTMLSRSAKTVPAAIEFWDIAGLVRGAAQGEGLGNQFLANIREVDAIIHLVRIFLDENITHVSGQIDPLFDWETINLELILADAQTLEKRLLGLERAVKQGNKAAVAEEVLLKKLARALSNNLPAASVTTSEAEAPILHSLHLLTAKPMLYVLNQKDGQALADLKPLQDYLTDCGAARVTVDAAAGSGLDELIAASYRLLGLITFFTTGEDETRAWTIKRGSTAPEAGRAIHSDFQTKFIKAVAVHCDDLLAAGSYAKARERGLVRTEGKEYVVKDGDVIEFKI